VKGTPTSGAVRTLCTVVIASVLGSCSLFDYSSMVSKRYALVYGVTNYVSSTDAHWANRYKDPNLTYPDSDAIQVAALLRAKGYAVVLRYVDGSDKEWFQGPNDASPTNTGSIATDTSGTQGPSKANIASDVATYFQGSAGQNDLFLFYFSGHGMQDAATSPPREYVVPLGALTWQADPLNPPKGSYVGVEAFSLRDDEMGSYLGALPTNRKVLIFDTCNSGGFIGNRLEADAIPPVYTGTNAGVTPAVISAAIAVFFSFPTSSTGLSPYDATVIAAAGRDEFSYEAGAPFSHGIMTYYLLQAGQSGDLNHDGHVTVSEAYSLIKAGIDQQWNSDPGVIAAQETFAPHISGGPIDFVLF
jgi:hypothetical protein